MSEIKKIRILVVGSDKTGVGKFRTIDPHVALEKKFPDEISVDIDYEPQLNNDEFLKQYDLIHYHRTLGPYDGMKPLLKKLKSFGIASIMDLDDYWDVGPHHPAYHMVKSSNLDKLIAGNIRLAENVMTTTSIFADFIYPENRNVYVIPNSINPTEKQFIPNPEASNRIRVAFLGGSSHLQDLKILTNVSAKLAKDNLLDKIQFVLCGFDLRGTMTQMDEITKQQTTRAITPKESVWYEYEKIFTNNYNIVSPEYKKFLLSFKNEEYPNVANEPYRRVWTKPITTYASNYNLFDISLAPLEENKFNKVKSQLKFTEAGFHKKAIIAQNFGPYKLGSTNLFKPNGEINPDGNSILIDSKNNENDWYLAIKKLVETPDLIKMLSNNLYNTVKDKFSMDTNCNLRRDLYLKLITKAKKNI